MAEPTLAIEMTELRKTVAVFLGWSPDPDDWDSDQADRMEVILKSGLRQFYYPTVMDGLMYDWSFLRPSGEVRLLSGSNSRRLPDDFGGFEGDVVVKPASGTAPQCPVQLYNEGQIDALFARSPTASGKPIAAASRPLRSEGADHGQRWEVYVYPEADTNYILRFRYSLHPSALTERNPWAYGGPAHAETIIESCLAVAEQREDDAMGVHTAKFKERLAASVAADRKYKPKTLGYNGDSSDGDDGNWGGDLSRRHGSGLTINGTEMY
jgi:hypothetical protein